MNLKRVLFVGVVICALAVGSMFGPVIGDAATTFPSQNLTYNQQNFNQNFTSTRGYGLGLGFYGLYDDIVATELEMTTSELLDLIQAGQTVEQIANEKGISTKQLINDLVVAITVEANQLVADNYITEAQRTAILDNLEADVTYAITSSGYGNGKGYTGFGTSYGMGGKGAYGFGIGNGYGYQLFDDIVANELGMTTTDLFDLVQNGQTIEQIANDKGISTDQLVNDLVEATEEQLNQLVEDNQITEEQRAAVLEDLEENINYKVQNSRIGSKQGRGGMGKSGQGLYSDDSSFQTGQGKGRNWSVNSNINL